MKKKDLIQNLQFDRENWLKTIFYCLKLNHLKISGLVVHYKNILNFLYMIFVTYFFLEKSEMKI